MRLATLPPSLLIALLVGCGPGLQPLSPGTGLQAKYFDNTDLGGVGLTQTDPQIDFDWADGAPRAGIPADGFSVRWSGELLAPYSEEYTFYTTTDDGVRLFVNGQKLIEEWQQQSASEYSAKITLEAGKRYTLRMEHYENTGVAVARLEWSSPTLSRQVVPSRFLYPAP